MGGRNAWSGVGEGISGQGEEDPLELQKRAGNVSFGCRQLEAIIRIAESLAKMKLQPFATEVDVEEALRLFQVSTLDAAMSGSLSGEGNMLCAGETGDMLALGALGIGSRAPLLGLGWQRQEV